MMSLVSVLNKRLNLLVFACSTSVTFHVCFRSLLANLALTSGSSSHPAGSLDTAWHAAASLISDIRSELVKPTPSHVTAASKRPSALSSFIQLEVETVSRQIEAISAVTDDLMLVLEGQSAATPPAVDALQSVASHRLPLKIASCFHPDLSGWIRDQQRRLLKLSRGGEDWDVFDMSVFSRPEGFLDAVVRHLARQQFKSLHSVHLTIDAVRCTARSCLILPHIN